MFFFFLVIWKEILFLFIEFNQLLVKSLFKMELSIGLGIEKVESDMTWLSHIKLDWYFEP